MGGIATEGNILWLKEKGFGYIVVSRKRKIELSPDTAMITVLAALSNGPDDDEIALHCHSTDKEIKEKGIKNLFERRFEEALDKIRTALSKKHGAKRYDKVVEKIGRLKERYKRITTSMKRDDGKIIHIRQSTRPEMFHKRIYDALCLPHRPGKTVRTMALLIEVKPAYN